MASTSTLVLGTAFGYDGYPIEDAWVFVESLRRFYSGDAIILVNSDSAELIRYLRSRRILPVFFDCASWMSVHVQLGRYVRYRELLRATSAPPPRYELVLLTDVSDVVFQANPFLDLPPGELLCFLESSTLPIGRDPINSQWVEEACGREALECVKDKTVSCSGITIGTQAAVLEYLDLLLSHGRSLAGRYPDNRGHDQGIHNFLLHTGALPRATLISNGQHVYTLGKVPRDEIALGPNGTLLDVQGSKPAIVHQYTTIHYLRKSKADVRQHVCSAYPIPRSTST